MSASEDSTAVVNRVATVLTVDIGNTRIKWALWDKQQMVHQGSSAYSRQHAQEAFSCWDDLEAESRVIVACVAGGAIENALSDWLQHNWSVTPEFLRSTGSLAGVTSAYRDPSQHGVDRWAALLGAHAYYQDPVCIIDAGTAVTFDLMDAKGRHRGGLILPGLAMMRHALLQGTAGIGQTEGAVTDFADNTADAVSSGTLQMLRAAIREISSSATRLLGSQMKIIITGGMAESILSLSAMPEMLHEPYLVLKGLRVAAETRAVQD